MKIAIDTSLLIRAAVEDHPEQSRVASDTMRRAEVIAISLPTLCEFVWVLRRTYQHSRHEILAALEALLSLENVIVDRPAVEFGLEIYRAGGDFADGVIAFEGRRLGAETFVTFDRQAATLLRAKGLAAQYPT